LQILPLWNPAAVMFQPRYVPSQGQTNDGARRIEANVARADGCARHQV
jgi:hypothetical protein